MQECVSARTDSTSNHSYLSGTLATALQTTATCLATALHTHNHAPPLDQNGTGGKELLVSNKLPYGSPYQSRKVNLTLQKLIPKTSTESSRSMAVDDMEAKFTESP